mmetsp:Transcript_9899/g.16494  ORF Transcript_9899/g.16494 Transcript_9899/m.16494 type:complete len:297 (+) Transcript_9899:79-969(+)|eukprot:CAMPEP_0119303016 /NCGR_PEP_ID=MMETSP1333-20130426/4517_1 /TAXON_ID=418940 /ORGANISM="Scyphosphaera apsteinii, Strain RCC1455" /LENGTH=296 /DNA_ID=CAMNT_0007305563 /DNA_START=75 /DNA_END=965 /DNA_ORIENTATION=+
MAPSWELKRQRVATHSSSSVEPSSSIRVAHIISKNPFRFNISASNLQKAGFKPRLYPPISQDDLRVQDIEHRLQLKGERKGRALAAISLTLTHAELWSSFPTKREWLWIFEDDVELSYRADLQCILDSVEAISASKNNSLIFLGVCSPDYIPFAFPGVFTKAMKLPHCFPVNHSLRSINKTLLEANHSSLGKMNWMTADVIRCAPLCLHAYGVRRSARTLWSHIYNAVMNQTDPSSLKFKYARYNMDINVRSYYQAGLGHWTTWPMCIRPAFGGVIFQNKGFAQEIDWHGSGNGKR